MMASSPSITFRPLYGAHASTSAISYILTVGPLNILLDCGQDPHFSSTNLQPLLHLPGTLHALLLSHSDISHAGAIPFLQRHGKLPQRVYATHPVWRMAQMTLYDTYLSLTRQRQFDLWDLDDVDAVFKIECGKFSLLKFCQSFTFNFDSDGKSGDTMKVVITPYAAGHMLGGSIWVIETGADKIVYAPDFNHRKERHLAPAALAALERPSHLISGARNAMTKLRGVSRMGEMMDKAAEVMKQGGNVLMPVDTAGRIVELALIVDDWWKEHGEALAVGCCCVLGAMARPTFEFARTMIEWMSEEVVTRFDTSRENVFNFKHLKLCNSMIEFRALPSPVLCLAPSASLEIGFSRDLFLEYIGNPRNAVILTDSCEMGTLAAHLAAIAQTPQNDQGGIRTLVLNYRRTEVLQGEELRLYQEKEKEEREAKAREVITGEDVRPSTSAEVEERARNEKQNEEDAPTLDLGSMPKQIACKKDMRKRKRTKRLIFPYVKKIEVWDEYGQVMDMKRYMTADYQDTPIASASDGAFEDPNAMEIAGKHESVVTMSSAAPQQVEDLPTKYVASDINVHVLCRVMQFDSAGLSDGDSARRLITSLEPRRIILVHGNAEETLYLASHLETTLFGVRSQKQEREVGDNEKRVLCPRDGEVVDITSNVFVASIPMQSDLVSNLTWRDTDGASLTYLDGKLDEDPETHEARIYPWIPLSVEETDAVMEEIAGGQPEEEVNYNSEARESDDESSGVKRLRGHGTLYVGTVMLNRLKEVLRAEGMRAEFAGGALCVENDETGAIVLVKKVGAEELVLEGSVCEEYYRIRDMLYKQILAYIERLGGTVRTSSPEEESYNVGVGQRC